MKSLVNILNESILKSTKTDEGFLLADLRENLF